MGFQDINIGIIFLPKNIYFPIDTYLIASTGANSQLFDISKDIDNRTEIGHYIKCMKQPKFDILMTMMGKLRYLGIETTNIVIDNTLVSQFSLTAHL